MINTFKFLGIIALVAVIGLSMVACDDDSNGNGGKDNVSGLNFDSALHGTWVSVSGAKSYNGSDMGTLVITSNSITGSPASSAAEGIADELNLWLTQTGVTAVKGSGDTITIIGGSSNGHNLYTYTVSGSTLTIVAPGNYGGTHFVGTKQ